MKTKGKALWKPQRRSKAPRPSLRERSLCLKARYEPRDDLRTPGQARARSHRAAFSFNFWCAGGTCELAS